MSMKLKTNEPMTNKTLLKNIFAKPIDRNIEGVIKADAENALKTEIEEYVITRELESRLESFLDSYNNYSDANGVWISGFFGSGKSHLLKMLALLLEKREMEDCDIVAEFLQKANRLDNPILAGRIEKALEIPTESILFNIDQKADVISKKQLDALVAVFVKVFDEHCGYYGKQAYIAQFERQLDEDGLFDDFRAAFQKHSGKEWDWGRQRINRVSGHVDAAHQDVTGSATIGVISAFRDDYRLSIEDFAEHVQQYIARQPKNFRLNFFVDEVGQYIADNVKLMTNLQTIAESLATKCKGQAWILVTAQGDMNTVVGEMDKEQGNDFSKIQGRFKERMNLSSQDVAEVIQKRILKKDLSFKEPVGAIYDHQYNNFKTLLAFSDGAQTYRNFVDREHFIDCYPFIPYQFELFQKSMLGLSGQNAFEGRHQSVGERSMLGVFQDVAKHIADKELGSLATFDLMYEGLRTALKSQIHAAIGTAEKNLDNKLAISLLKALFLVKYVREFKASIHNLTVLMLDRFDRNIGELKKEVTEAVNLLETETYIQRNGDLYEFLTDEEKDVEQEIKNTEIDSQEVADTLQKLLFDKVIKFRKMRYETNGHDYDYTKKVDDRTYGREHELALNVITPFHDHSGHFDHLKMESMGRKELMVVLPTDDRVIRDLQLIKQTERYVKQNYSLTQKESVRRILTEKQSTNQQRLAELQEHLAHLMGKCRMVVTAEDVESGSEDPQTRLMVGFDRLIESEFVNLKMLQGIEYKEEMVNTLLTSSQKDLFQSGIESLSEAEIEMLGFIKRETNKGMRTTVTSVVNHFERSPNGWYLAAIQCILAKLCARGKVEARADGELLSEKQLAESLLNTRSHTNMILEPQIELPQSQIRELKDFYQDFFNEPAPAGEASALGKNVAERFRKLAEDIGGYLQQSETYPFLKPLEEVKDKADQLAKKKSQYFFTDAKEYVDELLDYKENLLDPIRQFMSGSMAEIYADAQQFLKEQTANLDHMQSSAVQRIQNTLNDARCFAGNTMQAAKTDLTELKQAIQERIDQERTTARDAINSSRQKLIGMDEFSAMSPTDQASIEEQITQALQQIDHGKLIAVIRDKRRTFEEQTYPRLLDRVTRPPAVEPPPRDDESDDDVPVPVVVPSRIVRVKEIQVDLKHPLVTNEAELDVYLAALRKAVLEELQQGNRIQV